MNVTAARTEVVVDLLAELDRACTKFPDFPPGSRSAWKAHTIIAEEAGEIAKEMLHYQDEPSKGGTIAGIRAEAIQTAAMCVRFVEALDRGELDFA